MFEHCKQFALVEDGGDTVLGDNPGFVHFFHGVDLLGAFVQDSPDLAETALADDVLQGKVAAGKGAPGGGIGAVGAVAHVYY